MFSSVSSSSCGGALLRNRRYQPPISKGSSCGCWKGRQSTKPDPPKTSSFHWSAALLTGDSSCGKTLLARMLIPRI